MSTVVKCVWGPADPASAAVPPELFGFNVEITRKGGWRGLAAEMVANRKFAAVGDDGFPKRWFALGDGDAAVYSTADGYVGKQCVRVAQRHPGRAVGIVQDEETLTLTAGREYAVRLAVRTETAVPVTVRLTGAEGKPAAELEWPAEPGEWRLLTGKVTPVVSGRVRLEIFSTAAGTFYLGAVSLTPADAFHGMRRDVVELLKKLHPAQLRYPGGCYAEFYPWRDALLPVDRRPPIGPTGLWFLLPDGDDYDAHEIGVGEFLALCREVGAAPALTMRMNENTPEEAAALVEFCNGSPATPWGARRAALGGAEWPRVRTWFLGNELWSFGHGELKHAEACGRETARFAAAMRAADADLQLIGCTFYDRHDWNGAIVRHAGELLDGYSLHCYLVDRYNGRLSEIMRAVDVMLTPFICQVRDGLDRLVPAGRPYTILFDEWNFRWGGPGTVGMGIFAAGTLHLLCRRAAQLKISQAYFFMAVNEGIIRALTCPAELDIAGIIFDCCRKHAGRRLLTVTDVELPEQADLCATAAPDGGGLCVTVLNRSVSEPLPLALTLPAAAAGARYELTLWVPDYPDANSASYQLRREILTAGADGTLRLNLPPAAFACLA